MGQAVGSVVSCCSRARAAWSSLLFDRALSYRDNRSLPRHSISGERHQRSCLRSQRWFRFRPVTFTTRVLPGHRAAFCWRGASAGHLFCGALPVHSCLANLFRADGMHASERYHSASVRFQDYGFSGSFYTAFFPADVRLFFVRVPLFYPTVSTARMPCCW